jgi:cystathionine beta-lyase
MDPLLHITLEQLRTRRSAKWTTFDQDVIPAWVADMDFPVAPPIQQAMLRTIQSGDLGYPGEASAQSLAEAFAKRMHQRYNWQPDPALVMPTGNLIQALIASVASFSQAGDGVVIQTPIYYPFLKIVDALGRRLVESCLIPGQQRYEMDPGGLRQSIDKDTRVFLFCNPHNPTGRVFERHELEEVAAIAVENNLVVVSDEIHADLTYPGHNHIPLASLGPDIAARTITITSATKSFNIAGLKCAVIHFGSPELARQQQSFFNEHVLGSPNILGMDATMAAWRDGDEWLAAALRQLESNRNTVASFVHEHLPQINHYAPEASYLAWLDCSRLGLPARPYDYLLSKARVSFSDGREFSGHCPDFVRLNFATSPDILQEILERTRAAIEQAN